MRFLAPAALVTACLLVTASASADLGAAPTAVAPPVAAPALMAPPVAAPPAAAFAAPQAVPVASASPAPPPYLPAYAPPYMMYPQPGAGAPPPYWMPMAPPTEQRSPAMRTTGIVLFAAGGLLTAIGGVIFGAVATTECFDQAIPVDEPLPGPSPAGSRERVRSSRQALNACDTSPALGLGIMTAGVLTAAAGLPLFVIGSKQVPARTLTGKLTPVVTVGAANASARWTF